MEITLGIPIDKSAHISDAFSACDSLTDIVFTDPADWYTTSSETDWLNKNN